MKYNEQFFETILNHTSDVIMICDRNRHVVYLTPNAYEISGYGPEEWKDRDTFFLLHPDDREYMEKRHQNLLESEQRNSSEYRTIMKNGEVMYCECKTTPLPETKNYLQVVSMRDITERKLMEMDLEYHKNRHETLQNSLKRFSSEITTIMKLVELEDKMLKEVESILPGSNPIILTDFPSEVRDLQDGKLVTVSNKIFIKIGDLQQLPYILTLEANGIHDQMEIIWLETLIHYSMMLFENLLLIENLMVQLETAAQQKNTPQWMLKMMFDIQEQQRNTLSSDLHDTVLQDQIDIYRRLESILHRDEIEETAKSKLIQIEQGLLDIIHDIRTTCNNLRPPLLRELGIESALINLFDHVQLTSTYKIRFSPGGLSALSISEYETIGIYRIVQELLHYAEFVSGAQDVTFDFCYKNNSLVMTYHDDGIGYVEMIGHDLTNVKLNSVNQRVQSLGGKIDIISKTGGGLRLLITLPIDPASIHAKKA
ncbi:PAS domain S-box protein [Fredinandcohnia sp. 179-A 10B2 NHS]|uniref:PAS domain-containing sensor histidine kinase n=1 Tax=Fredinandcohnia sp. 179-A 10B2 NHS TaxID=3235176 RepID=UPI0039A12AC4